MTASAKKLCGALLALVAIVSPVQAQTGSMGYDEIAVEAPFAMPLIKSPVFPKRDFVVTEFGARQDSDISEAIRKAIAACHDAGGGRVIIPAGKWLTGKIHFKSNVNLHLEKGATLSFSDNPEDYLPAVQSSWEGFECFNYSPLIYAFNCENVALTGEGMLEARMGTWKKWFARPEPHLEALKKLYTMSSTNVPVEQRQMAEGENHLRPQFIQFNRCRNVLIDGLSIHDSPFWTVHLFLSESVVVRGLKISAHGHNNDGIDPEMTRNLLIENCRFDQGDDAIAIKSGSNQDGWRLGVPTENVVIRNCTVVEGHQLVAIGSELSAGIRNIYVHDCRFANPDYRLQNVLFIKTNIRRGGFVENIHMENIEAKAVRYSVLGIETDVLYQWKTLVPTYEERLTKISGIHVKNVKVEETGLAPFRILGDKRAPVKDVFLDDITISKAHIEKSHYENVENVRETNIKIGEILPEGNEKQQPREKFDFGSGKAQAGYTQVTPQTAYDAKRGFGFLDSASATPDQPRVFAVDVEEGNYEVTMRFGDPTIPTSTTVKAEQRRLMLEHVETAPGKFETRTFTMNVRKPAISTGGTTSLNDREKGPPPAPDWDDKFTFEFNGKHPGVASMEIKPARDALTVFLAGDSTVTDQRHEPYAGWGQMLPRFFAQGVAVSNQAESGLALYSFERQKRLEKILSMMKKGDYLFIQFGHNDQKDKSSGAGPFTSYKANLKRFVEAARSKGGIPVLVTPMERRRWNGNEPEPTLADYAEAVRQAGAEAKAPVIDLNAMSLKLYTVLGPDKSTKAFVHYPANTFPGQDKALKDDTHHNAYGGYELARCVVEGIKANVPALATHLVKDVGAFDPANPDPPEKVDIPARPATGAIEKPAGN